MCVHLFVLRRATGCPSNSIQAWMRPFRLACTFMLRLIWVQQGKLLQSSAVWSALVFRSSAEAAIEPWAGPIGSRLHRGGVSGNADFAASEKAMRIHSHGPGFCLWMLILAT